MGSPFFKIPEHAQQRVFVFKLEDKSMVSKPLEGIYPLPKSDEFYASMLVKLVAA